MLTSLSVRDVVLIERLELELGPGLTVLTGETGAGKSILLDALGLALGERAGAGLVRADVLEATVRASFEVPRSHAAFGLLAESGIDVEAEEGLMLRRHLARDGRSRAFVNDQPVGVALLRRVGALLVEVQGQHEQVGLADPATHRALLDRFGGNEAPLARTRTRFIAWRAAATALAEAEAALEAAAREEDWLRASAAELAALDPGPDEELALADRRIGLQRSERRREAIAAALGELAPSDRRRQGPAAALRAGARALSRIAPVEGEAGEEGGLVVEAQAAIERAEVALAEAESVLSRLASEAGDDPRALEAAEERLFALRAASRKYAVPVGELAGLLDGHRRRIASLEAGVVALAELRAAEGRSRALFEAGCAELTAARIAAARRLERAVAGELQPLKLDRARFVVSIETLAEAQRGEHGADRVAFLIAANPGQAPAPLGRVASGGELSRLMLALRVVLARGEATGTLVFDEVDAGIGGATASAVGERLLRLAADRQVLVVTHSPQVAARGDRHLTVSKRVTGGVTRTEVSALESGPRREEIARMLAGERVTDAARAAASSLIERRA